MRKAAFLALACALALASMACARRTTVIEGPHGGKVVVVERGHVHTAHCGHYWHRGSWYHAAAHVHGDGCGHVHREGRWIIVD
jgi:hypothetical protein